MNECNVRLKGAPNFRDIGGYNTNNGKKVKTGMIFRSGELSKTKRSDLNQIAGLNIKLIIDLRNEYERAHKPSRLPKGNIPKTVILNMHNNSIDYRDLYKKALAGKLGNFDFHEFILAEYRRYVTQHEKELQRIFKLLLDPENYPVLIHCNGGKDRTGTVAALIHFALGVSREKVFHEYMLSREHMKKYIKKMTTTLKLISLFRINIKQLMPVLETHSMYLQEALDTIDDRHGNMDAYLEYLGMGREPRKQLGEILCCET